jgi:hypothetical protein
MAVARLEHLQFAIDDDRWPEITLSGFVNELAFAHETAFSQRFELRELTIVELYERDAFGIAIKLLVPLLLAHKPA